MSEQKFDLTKLPSDKQLQQEYKSSEEYKEHVKEKVSSKRSQAIYDTFVKPLISEQKGKFIVVEKKTGRYAITNKEFEAYEKAKELGFAGECPIMEIGDPKWDSNTK